MKEGISFVDKVMLERTVRRFLIAVQGQSDYQGTLRILASVSAVMKDPSEDTLHLSAHRIMEILERRHDAEDTDDLP